jgi:hypothetical protein
MVIVIPLMGMAIPRHSVQSNIRIVIPFQKSILHTKRVLTALGKPTSATFHWNIGNEPMGSQVKVKVKIASLSSRLHASLIKTTFISRFALSNSLNQIRKQKHQKVKASRKYLHTDFFISSDSHSQSNKLHKITKE